MSNKISKWSKKMDTYYAKTPKQTLVKDLQKAGFKVKQQEK